MIFFGCFFSFLPSLFHTVMSDGVLAIIFFMITSLAQKKGDASNNQQ
jgi:hypothetical protein